MKISYLTYLKNIFFSLMFLTLPFALAEQFIYQEAAKVDDKTYFGVVGMVLGMIETFLLLVLLGYGIKKCQNVKTPNIGLYYKKYLRDIIIESLRGMGRIAIGLLLIVPGLKRIIIYYLIPYIVQFDSEYADGKVDVLIEAERLLKNHFWKFTGLLCLTQIVMFVVQTASVNFNLFTTPLAWILFYLIEIILEAGVFWIFYNYYLDLKSSNSKEVV
jgi:hypothetical protein